MKTFINSLIASGSNFVNNVNDILIKHRLTRKFEDGLRIYVPEHVDVLEDVWIDEFGQAHQLVFMPVEFVYPDGERTFDKLFFASLTKCAFDADSGSLVRAQGSIPAFIDTCCTIGEAIEVLQGTIIKVSNKRYVTNRQGRTTFVCNFDFE